MSGQPAKVIIKVDTGSELDQTRNVGRKTLKVLQKNAIDKENLAGRPSLPSKSGIVKPKADSETELTELAKRKQMRTQTTQTDPVMVSEPLNKYNEKPDVVIQDITGAGAPSEGYWQIMAERRRKALQETLEENEFLHQRVAVLEAQLQNSREMLDEAQSIVDILTELINDSENGEKRQALDKGPSTSLNSTGCSQMSLEYSTVSNVNANDSDED